ncbi:hypothetical protein BDU57DRAFT_38614 [Ampelomyces quisqualis]|uniref:Uncharacterized protein n=1 Tax=Ampelomyces quisqualis TaxID=50730 RepID=A0A6A5R2X3_AMPQU|nr:hypothetical protein BDU57DRAFT_38614 [Ampelomyces quisqualis]
MADNIEPNADLASILATLANLQQQGSSAIQNQEQGYDTNQTYQSYQEDAPAYPIQQGLPYHQTADPRLLNRSISQHLPTTPKLQNRVSTPLIDPATITEWKQGLRCVSKIAQHNPDFAASVRKVQMFSRHMMPRSSRNDQLMKDQEGNVKQWEAGRERLLEDQRLKRENEATHRAALSLPGLLEGTPLLRTPEREKSELSQYDAKVYRACKAMTEAQSSALKILGVPFFGTKPHLILSESSEPGSSANTEQKSENQKINNAQLLDLQRKMLNHLMELYGD